MGYLASKKTSLKAGDVVDVSGGYGHGTILDFASRGDGESEDARVRLDGNERTYWVSVNRLAFVAEKADAPDKKSRYYDLYVRDAVWTPDGELGLIVDFVNGGCGIENAKVVFHDGSTREYNVLYYHVTLAVAAKR